MGGMLTTALRILFLILLVSDPFSMAIKLKRVYSKDSCSNPNSECAKDERKVPPPAATEVVSTPENGKPSYQSHIQSSQSLYQASLTTVAVVPPRGSCSSVGEDACADKQGFDAISALHRQLDDDANGNIDIDESDEFLRDELQYENGAERQKTFHGNDKHISVDELWKSWKTSEVHNWTIEETVKWLTQSVELPQYSQLFHEHSVNGTALPAMAVQTTHFLSFLGIKDPIHKQKIALKAMDIVLFGPPRHHNYVKDVLLVFLMLLASGGCWFAFVQHKYSQTHLKKMMRDMDSLQHAEEALRDMQVELEQAKRENSEMNSRLRNERLQGVPLSPLRIQEALRGKTPGKDSGPQDESSSGDQSPSSETDSQMQAALQELEEELQNVREELRQAETALEARAWSAPPALQKWLQLTYEIEQRHYNAKKAAAELQLAAAKEGCEKIRKRRTSFLGTFRIAHGTGIDDVDTWILQAKSALSEVTKDLQERLHRWRQVELLCGVSIVQNPGLVRLESMLRGPPNAPNGSAISAASKALSNSVRGSPISRSCSEGTLLEEELSSSGAAPFATISAGNSLVHLGPSYLNPSPQHSLQQLPSPNLHSQHSLRPNVLGLPSQPLQQLEEETATEDEVDNGELDYYYEDHRNLAKGLATQSTEEGIKPALNTSKSVSSDGGSPTSLDSGSHFAAASSIRSRFPKASLQEQAALLSFRTVPTPAATAGTALGQSNDLSSPTRSEAASVEEISSTSESSSSVNAPPSSTSSSIGASQIRTKKVSGGNIVSALRNSKSGGSSLDEAETDSSSDKTRKKSSSLLSKLKRKSKAV